MNEHMPHEEVPLGQKQSGEWEGDLHADDLKGRNTGMAGPHPEKRAGNTAYDTKPVHRLLHGFTDDELKQILVMPHGSRLEQGATYVDLADPARREFRAMGGERAETDHWYIPKAETDPYLWNRMTGVKNPERLGKASET